MKRWLNIGAAVAVLIAGSMASAQETGSLITRKPAQIDSRDKDAVRKTLEIFSTCVMERAYGRVIKMVDMRIDVPEYAKQMDSISSGYDDCLSGGDLNVTNGLFRGGLFRALYMREFKLDGPVMFDPAFETGYRDRYPAPYSEEARSSIAMESFAECVSRADGVNVRVLVGSVAGSSVETAAIQALAPKLGPCIAQGNQIRFTKLILKGALAEGLYRLSMASKSGAGVK
ncbi:MAG: hypothetical protein AABY88_10820 [Pseudomonadota bacterium]